MIKVVYFDGEVVTREKKDWSISLLKEVGRFNGLIKEISYEGEIVFKREKVEMRF